MTKDFLDKITVAYKSGSVDSVSAEEKKEMIAYLSNYGFTVSTFYLRFFSKGFSPWEIIGVTECKKQFLDSVPQTVLEEASCSPETLLSTDGAFYNFLKQAHAGFCVKFIAMMCELGMSSGTVVKRFSTEKWKPWEQEGIKALLEKYIKS